MERIKAVWSIDFFSGGVKWGLKRGIKEVKWNLNYVNYRGIKPFLSFREVVDIHFETLVVGVGVRPHARGALVHLETLVVRGVGPPAWEALVFQ